MKSNHHPVVLLCASRWYPLSVRLAMAFISHGVEVSALCPKGHPLRLLTGMRAFYRYRRLDSLAALKAAIRIAQPDIVVPCDDGVVLQLHALHAQEPSLRPVIERSLGEAWAYPILDSRDQLLRVAAELGIRIPLSRSITAEAELADWPEPAAVLKADGSMGGEGIAVARCPADITAAYRTLSMPLTAAMALKRFLVNRNPLAMWMYQRFRKPSILLQQFIPGRPANTMLACWRGEMLASVTVEVLSSQGAIGAATVVRLIRHPEIEEAARRLARRLMLTGFCGLDFMLEQKSGDPGSSAAYLIEMNPRCTQLGHLRLPGQGDLAKMLIAAMQQGTPSSALSPFPDSFDNCVQGDTVAFFPQALFWNPRSPHLYTAYHDVPWEAPELVRELLLEEWPYRQLAARIYHSVRPPARKKAVQFENPDPVSLGDQRQKSLPRLS